MLSQGERPVGYEERGAGPPVVLLHPFPFSRLLWAGLDEVLARRHRVIAIDARGFGETPLGGRYAIADLADDLASLLDRLDVPRATLVGMSMGGYTALGFANRHAGRLAALVLADTRAGADGAEARAGREVALRTIERAGPEAYLAASLPRLFSPAAPPALVTFARARGEARASSLRAGIEALRDRPDRTAELGAIRCPTLVIGGAGDQVTPAADLQAMAAAISGAELAVLPEAGHLCHLETPGPFERALSAFLARVAEERAP